MIENQNICEKYIQMLLLLVFDVVMREKVSKQKRCKPEECLSVCYKKSSAEADTDWWLLGPVGGQGQLSAGSRGHYLLVPPTQPVKFLSFTIQIQIIS